MSSFGFRGEALSSLCALGEMQITTRTVAQDVGTQLRFDSNGAIVASEPVAREVCLPG